MLANLFEDDNQGIKGNYHKLNAYMLVLKGFNFLPLLQIITLYQRNFRYTVSLLISKSSYALNLVANKGMKLTV